LILIVQWLLWLFIIMTWSGCAGRQPTTAHSQAHGHRDTALAEELHRQGVNAYDAKNVQLAETMFRNALKADAFYGPSHNNLGVLLMNAGKLYEAAEHFEYARKLLPGHPDPRHNLAMTFELAGRVDDAIKAYSAALEVYPEYLPSVMGLAKLQIKTDRSDSETPKLLRHISMRAEDVLWRDWAGLQLVRLEGRESLLQR
jgi:tetratricopeptide (TPR) repeat protein